MFRTVVNLQAATQYRQKLKHYLLKQLLEYQNTCTKVTIQQEHSYVVSN